MALCDGGGQSLAASRPLRLQRIAVRKAMVHMAEFMTHSGFFDASSRKCMERRPRWKMFRRAFPTWKCVLQTFVGTVLAVIIGTQRVRGPNQRQIRLSQRVAKLWSTEACHRQRCCSRVRIQMIRAKLMLEPCKLLRRFGLRHAGRYCQRLAFAWRSIHNCIVLS